jgi:hypothetical protein
MPRWGGWTSDLNESAEHFGRYYPERVEQMRIAAATGRTPSTDPAVLSMLVDDLGPWLAAEYSAVHGEKTPRPERHPPTEFPGEPAQVPRRAAHPHPASRRQPS